MVPEQWFRWQAAYRVTVAAYRAGAFQKLELLARLCALGFTPETACETIREITFMHDGLSLRDREEMRDATMQRYVQGDITATQARGELGRQGWNATQVSELMREGIKAVVSETLAARGIKRDAL